MNNTPATQASPISSLKKALNAKSVQEQFKNAMADSAPLFIASLIDVVSSDNRLKECNPNDIIREALKAATLKLPINKSLGFAWLVPRKERGRMRPVFQIGYKGYIQLALRTGAYRYINAGPVYEGELVSQDKLTGEIDLSGEKKSDMIIGYFAHLETVNGFRKTVYGTVDDIIAHAKKFSQSYGKDFSAWTTNFDAMATKTMLTALLGKYGVMSVEIITALAEDNDDISETPNTGGGDKGEIYGGETIDIEPTKPPAGKEVNEKEPLPEMEF